MIQYSLKCADGHQFDSWFQSASAFDKLQAAGHVACAVCGTEKVEKALMAPRVGLGDTPETAPEKPLSKPANPAEQALGRAQGPCRGELGLCGHAVRARGPAMHAGDAPERPIWGEAKGHEAKALIEDGIKVAPLPFTPTRKSN